MSLVRTEELISDAVSRKAAVPAFNAITLEHAEAIASAAEIAGAPVIIQISHNAIRFHNNQLAAISTAVREVAISSSASIALHLDHVEELELLQNIQSFGYSSAMFDPGAIAFSENISATLKAREITTRQNLFLEAELGYVGGKESAPKSAHEKGVRTEPAEAREFVEKTQVDALAVAVGSSHAMVTQTAVLDTELIAALSLAVPIPLVLHGSSGVPLDQIRASVASGMRKINVGTALNIAFTQAIRDYLAKSEKVDPRPYLKEARDQIITALVPLIRVIQGLD